MRLAKIDLKNLVAIGHEEDRLALLIDRGETVEYIEIEAPISAYEGLQKVSYIANHELSAGSSDVAAKALSQNRQLLAMLPVKSSMAKAIGYDAHQKVLRVEFANGSVYQYEQVENQTWDDFRHSSSIGKFFNREIKGTYQSQRVDPRQENKICLVFSERENSPIALEDTAH